MEPGLANNNDQSHPQADIVVTKENIKVTSVRLNITPNNGALQ